MSERRTVHKWFWVWEFEKEEQWLNTMAQSGWLLDRVGFCRYDFIACEPGTYAVRLEMRDHDEDYLRFMGETGAEYIGRMAKWIYFRKKTADGAFDIFSDIDSRIGHLNRIARMLTIVAIFAAVVGLNCIHNLMPLIGGVDLLGAALLMYALGRIHGKKESLEKDRLLLE